jgi:paraquat-inducible protein B
MSKQVNTRVIGGCIVGTLVLALMAVLVLGSGKWFSHKEKFVLFFTDSISGLGIGAPVDFRGVKIGSVTDIKVDLDKKDLSLLIPVFIEIDPKRLTFAGTRDDLHRLTERYGARTFLQLLIKRGLRAELVMQSAITGRYGIHLNFYRNKPLNLVLAETEYQEIPTIPSRLSEIANTIQKLPLTEIVGKLFSTVDTAKKLINSPDIKGTVLSFQQAAQAGRTLWANVGGEVKPLSKEAKTDVGEARKMFANTSKVGTVLGTSIPPLAAALKQTAKTARLSLQGADGALGEFAQTDSHVRLQFLQTLNEMAFAVRSLRVLSDYLVRHPEVMLRGKSKEK